MTPNEARAVIPEFRVSEISGIQELHTSAAAILAPGSRFYALARSGRDDIHG